MNIQISVQDKTHKSQLTNLQGRTDAELEKLSSEFYKGCKKIFHRPGYMNVKGDAPYDFTCDSSHRCPKCDGSWHRIFDEKKMRAEQKTKIQNKKRVEIKKKQIKQKYFNGQPGCECKPDKMCKACLDKLQADVTKYEKGCGAQWSEQFGGMAAGPAYVTCKDNYFLCDKCQQQVDFITKINQEYPHVKLEHMPKIQRDYWSPSTYPYYSGLL